jgi:O-antigen/teichoic acid export membrane protein
MSEIVDFKAALDAAGQPWSRLGIRVIGAGILALLALQLIPRVPYGFYALIAAVGVIAVGWVMLIVAVLKRRRWVKAQVIEDVPLAPDTLTRAP